MARAGAVEPLVAMLGAGDAQQDERAACALYHLAHGHEENQVPILLLLSLPLVRPPLTPCLYAHSK